MLDVMQTIRQIHRVRGVVAMRISNFGFGQIAWLERYSAMKDPLTTPVGFLIMRKPANSPAAHNGSGSRRLALECRRTLGEDENSPIGSSELNCADVKALQQPQIAREGGLSWRTGSQPVLKAKQVVCATRHNSAHCEKTPENTKAPSPWAGVGRWTDRKPFQ